MKKCMILFIMCYSLSIQGAAVTYTYSGGRFGDQLLSYAHARWVAYKYDIPFLYRPFSYSNELALSTLHQTADPDFDKKSPWRKYGGKVELDSIINPAENKLYVIPYFPDSPFELAEGRWHFDIDWDDEKFFKILKHEISPLNPVQQLSLPNDRVSVAVHMRKGGGFKEDILLQDADERKPNVEYVDVRWPHKFPPFDYYVEQIITVSELLGDQPLYVHVFTDDQNPAALVEKCKAAVNKPNIVYGSRLNDNRYNANVLDDFFALTQFDCLIRGDSNFSIMASKLARYKIQISPKNSRWEGTKLVITEVYIDKAATLVYPGFWKRVSSFLGFN